MLIYFREVPLDEGFSILELPKASRLVRGVSVSPPSGLRLYVALRAAGEALKCWSCGIEANCFVLNRGQRDFVGSPTLDLFARTRTRYVLMTRDHIIPKSWGGIDANENLRVGCSNCNGERGNMIDKDDQAFMDVHPELIHRSSSWKAPSPSVHQEPTPEVLERRRVKAAARRKKRRQASKLAKRAKAAKSAGTSV